MDYLNSLMKEWSQSYTFGPFYVYGILTMLLVSLYLSIPHLTQANNREKWNEKIRPYYAAKHYADKVLVASDLNYTIVRPGCLLNEAGTGRVKIVENLERGSIPREDVARVLFEILAAENTYKKSFDLISGDDRIQDAVENI